MSNVVPEQEPENIAEYKAKRKYYGLRLGATSW